MSSFEPKITTPGLITFALMSFEQLEEKERSELAHKIRHWQEVGLRERTYAYEDLENLLRKKSRLIPAFLYNWSKDPSYLKFEPPDDLSDIRTALFEYMASNITEEGLVLCYPEKPFGS